ncbi:sigma-54 dependent transcriptional regulator [Eggerthella sp. YY7918]|uniref:sigma-54-dependent transcriptional regulator n=1 Tax=Eggerthella sp. (strain YY7918) TaxID=502558 RepID=UPI0002171100|nr:sigma-54 dependent transcriptional regulator [Eggerthella sp. YY7918]BAK43557.1 transcriptional activator of acetoin [Eggerthella sp. YY7918]
MVYQKEHAIEAWKTFVSSGTILEGKVRPEIARSWIRCRRAGVNPWSNDFADQNAPLLEEKRSRFAASLRATTPVMKFLKTMLGSNVSLMDGENFVFELISPLPTYPRTYGTFMREEDVGTGNATIVAYEKRPVRVDGFEHYRAIAQNYSGVAAPYLDSAGKYFGALNINSPFAVLPQSALELCTIGLELTNDLFRARSKAGALLSTVDFFKPLMLAYEHPVLLIDFEGRILGANAWMRPYCPDWEQYSYGSQSLGAYLGKDMGVRDILGLLDKLDAPMSIKFKKGRSRAVQELSLVRQGVVDIEGQEPFIMLVFENGGEVERNAKTTAGRRSNAEVMPTGDKVDYIGETEEWQKIDRMVQKVAPIKTNVLLLGETGTGKEVVARALHRRSGRTGEFVAINCGALPRDLLATELFGYEGGAFTGARETGAIGKFEYADGGTLFLDEIGEMPVDMQVSLLRVLQEQSVTKLGSNTSKALDVRVIAATNQNIERLIAEKKFRSDLYYRLSLVEIRLPQLRRRVDDIPLLAEYFNGQLSPVLNLPYTPLPAETIDALRAYSWPGNVRELRNIVERCLIMQGEGSKVTVESLPAHIANAVNTMPGGPSASAGAEASKGEAGTSVEESWRAEERRRIVAALERCDGNLAAAASELGLHSDELVELLSAINLRVQMVVEDAAEA